MAMLAIDDINAIEI